MRNLARIVLAVAFLVAQHTALAHQIWHAAGEPAKSSQSSRLCDQHAALGTVLGALNGCAPIAVFVQAAPCQFPAADSPAAFLPGLPPASRGPPSLS